LRLNHVQCYQHIFDIWQIVSYWLRIFNVFVNFERKYWNQSSAICFGFILEYCAIIPPISCHSFQLDLNPPRIKLIDFNPPRIKLIDFGESIYLPKFIYYGDWMHQWIYYRDWKLKYCNPAPMSGYMGLECTICKNTYHGTRKWNQICSFQNCILCGKQIVFSRKFLNELKTCVIKNISKSWKCGSCIEQFKLKMVKNCAPMLVDKCHIKIHCKKKTRKKLHQF